MDLGPVDRITADAIGDPGQRVFYIQARAGSDLVTVVVEKQQVQLLSASVLELMATLGIETGEGPDESQMDIEEPFEPRWRAGRLALGFDQTLGVFTLEIEEFRPEPDEEPEMAQDEPSDVAEGEAEIITLLATREQMFALSRHGVTVAARGRPACQFCGNPMDPEGHACPAMNGHSKR
jgi:uncharacterized repeat protein (TIGR03847 family)